MSDTVTTDARTDSDEQAPAPTPGAHERNMAKVDEDGRADAARGDAPTEPRQSSAGPLDAAAGRRLTTERGHRVRVGGTGGGTPGPEDAMDPTLETIGDYSDLIEDAHHYSHQPIVDPDWDGPQSAPMAQNERARRALAEQTPTVPSDKDTTSDEPGPTNPEVDRSGQV